MTRVFGPQGAHAREGCRHTVLEIQEDGAEGLRRRSGRSTDRRSDLPQMVIGLAVTRSGLPVRCWVWPGNTADVTRVEEVKRDLIAWKLARVVTVVDRGFVSEENPRVLQRAGGHYIAGERLRAGKPGGWRRRCPDPGAISGCGRTWRSRRSWWARGGPRALHPGAQPRAGGAGPHPAGAALQPHPRRAAGHRAPAQWAAGEGDLRASTVPARLPGRACAVAGRAGKRAGLPVVSR